MTVTFRSHGGVHGWDLTLPELYDAICVSTMIYGASNTDSSAIETVQDDSKSRISITALATVETENLFLAAAWEAHSLRLMQSLPMTSLVLPYLFVQLNIFSSFEF